MQFIIDELSASPAFSQVAAAPLHTAIPALSTNDEIVTLFDSIFEGRVYALSMRTDKAYPSLVHTLVGTERYEVGPYVLTQTERYVLEIRAKSLGDLVAVVDQVNSAIINSAYGIKSNDMALQWDDKQELWGCFIEAAFSLPSSGNQVPAVLVAPLGKTWATSKFDGCSPQKGTEQHLLAIMTGGDDTQSLEESAIAAVLGKQGPGYFRPIRLVASEPIGHPGGLTITQLVIEHERMTS